jgi:hypothetical protein
MGRLLAAPAGRGFEDVLPLLCPRGVATASPFLIREMRQNTLGQSALLLTVVNNVFGSAKLPRPTVDLLAVPTEFQKPLQEILSDSSD